MEAKRKDLEDRFGLASLHRIRQLRGELHRQRIRSSGLRRIRHPHPSGSEIHRDRQRQGHFTSH